MTTFLNVSGAEVAVVISAREYNRLLSLPRDRMLEGDLLDRAESARNWYARYGTPFVASERIEIKRVNSDTILLAGGETLQSAVLAQRLINGDAHALVFLAASAGPEVADQVSRHWTEGRPDEAYFLDRFAVAITEHLIFWAAATLCRASEPLQETLLPHLSPGCGQWDLADQHKLMRILTGSKQQMTLGPLKMLSTGALYPQHSVLAAMGVTHKNFALTPESLCRACDMNPCRFRRAPYSGVALHLMEIR